MTFFEKMSHWTAFLGGLTAFITAAAGLYAGSEAIKQFQGELTADTPPIASNVDSSRLRLLEQQITANSILIEANKSAAEIALSSKSSAEASTKEFRSLAPDVSKLQNKIQTLVNENKTLKSSIDAIVSKPKEIATKFDGWVYLGKFSNGTWNNKTIKGYDSAPPKEGDVIEFSDNVNLRVGKPRFPLYRIPGNTSPASLGENTKAKIVIIDNSVGARNFSWAKVSSL